jgi:acetyl esterase/lipase
MSETAQEAPRHEPRVDKKIQFAEADGKPLFGDLYRPAHVERPCGIFVFVHGGGWIAGSRASGEGLGRLLARAGYACFSVDYRLARTAAPSYPGAVDDVRAAIDFLRAEAARFEIDGERIALFGASAGGHLSALAALTTPLEAAYLRALVCVYGIYDLKTQWDHEITVRPRGNLVEALLGCSPMEDRRVYFEASPISHVSLQRRKLPVFLGYGLQDDVVPHRQSEAFLLALSQCNCQARKYVAADAGHFWLNEDLLNENAHSRRFIRAALAFVRDAGF